MINSRMALIAVCALAGCASSVPDSNPYSGRGVGFGGADSYAAEQARRDAALEAAQASPVPEEQVIASETLGVLNATRTAGSTEIASASAPVSSEPLSAIDPAAVETAGLNPNNPEISDEQNFDAVSSRESIESDKERLERQREAFEVVQPQALPERPSGSSGPSIVEFALSTTNSVGQPMYRRSGTVSDSKYQRACAKYTTSDQAQEAFLKSGGPRSDRQGLDPDGDGFACSWDPTPFRMARGG